MIDWFLYLPHGLLTTLSDGQVESSINLGMTLFEGTITKDNAWLKFQDALSGPKRFCWKCGRMESLKQQQQEEEEEEDVFCV